MSPGPLRTCLIVLALAASVGMLSQPEHVHAQVGNDLELSTVSQPASEVQPGSVVTMSFRVVNLLPTPRTFAERLLLPQGWTKVAADTVFTLDPAASEIRLVSFNVPRTAPAGLKEVIYALGDSGAGENAAEASNLVGVAGKRTLRVSLVDSQKHIASGRTYTAQFVLTMEGNVGGWVFLTATSSSGFSVAVAPPSVHILPGDRQAVSVTVPTTPGLSQKRYEVLSLSAQLEGDTLPSATAASFIEVLPLDGGSAEYRNRVPAYAALRAAGEGDDAGVQGEVALSGMLFPERRGEVDFLVRTPDLQQHSILGPLDEYRLSYAEEMFDLQLGDQTYALSPLTESARYAFGAGGRLRLSDVTVGGFYNRNRRSTAHQEEAGAFTALDLNKSARVSLQVLGKDERSQSGIASIRTLLKPTGSGNLDVEFGRAFREKEKDDALSIWWYGRSPRVFYDLRYVEAGPGYTGYWRDVDLKYGNVIVYPWQLLRLEATVREEERNLDRDTTLYSAPRELFYEFGTGYGNYVFARYRLRKLNDLLPTPAYQRDERTGLLRGGYNTQTWSALAEAEAGTYSEHTRAREGNYHRIALFLSVFPEWWHSYGLTLEHLREPNLYSDGSVTRWAGSISARVAITPTTHVYAGLQGNRTEGAFRSTFLAFEASVDHQFRFGHTVSARVRNAHYTPSSSMDDLSWLVEYVIPFDLPLGRLTRFGGLSGRILDAATQQGVPEVIVSTGPLTVLTDADGRFSFPGLTPGTHRLSVDVATLGHGRVLERPLDQGLLVQGGEETVVEIRATRAGELLGKVTIHAFSISASGDTLEGEYQETGIVPSALVEVSSGDILMRQFTDSRGRFRFPELPPGDWTVRILDGPVPDGHRLEQEKVDVRLAPGGRQEILFRILPVRRTIRILDSGQILQP